MIVDSSVWIDYLRHGRGRVADQLDEALRRRKVLMLPVILQEILQGADSPQRFAAWQRAFEAVPVAHSAEPQLTAIHAAGLYARCRWADITVRSANDCLIAASCIELDEPLLHLDRDFERIAEIEPRLRIAAA
ncbi:PIN domain-containing protein [Dokdonella sp.]|uniref:type II toxin-antitoxin system VapC family toxin n=1 Tax=Dokdonella sp. TaxID=2291710 RepID=UPI001B0351A1|nr:PIN domain-containing protein [Dokdonella sp.]MBO9661712.1 PIN domain-containing protein [Dokdonella sp.]